ncbi:hypothetical protein BBJ28_00023196 [Nothophytophthora sp. Chile5]|nr:hypothetical protein BBJ28_00023196 [Nothophytophthora sp. Chile5]
MTGKYKATVAIALIPHPLVAWRSLAVLHVARPRVFGGALKVPLDPQFWNVCLPAASPKDVVQCRFSVQHGAEKKRERFRAPCRFVYDDWVRCLRAHMAPPSLAWLHCPDTPRESLAMTDSPAGAREMAISDNTSCTSSIDWIETTGTVATTETVETSEDVPATNFVTEVNEVATAAVPVAATPEETEPVVTTETSEDVIEVTTAAVAATPEETEPVMTTETSETTETTDPTAIDIHRSGDGPTPNADNDGNATSGLVGCANLPGSAFLSSDSLLHGTDSASESVEHALRSVSEDDESSDHGVYNVVDVTATDTLASTTWTTQEEGEAAMLERVWAWCASDDDSDSDSDSELAVLDLSTIIDSQDFNMDADGVAPQLPALSSDSSTTAISTSTDDNRHVTDTLASTTWTTQEEGEAAMLERVWAWCASDDDSDSDSDSELAVLDLSTIIDSQDFNMDADGVAPQLPALSSDSSTTAISTSTDDNRHVTDTLASTTWTTQEEGEAAMLERVWAWLIGKRSRKRKTRRRGSIRRWCRTRMASWKHVSKGGADS